MSKSRRVPPVAAPGLLLVAVFVVLAGLLGMHGLGSHGPEMPATPSMAHPMMAAPAMADAPADGAVLSGSMPSMHMGGTCVAVLLSLLLLFMARQEGVAALLRRSVTSRPLRTQAVPRSPPDLVALGIHRC